MSIRTLCGISLTMMSILESLHLLQIFEYIISYTDWLWTLAIIELNLPFVTYLLPKTPFRTSAPAARIHRSISPSSSTPTRQHDPSRNPKNGSRVQKSRGCNHRMDLIQKKPYLQENAIFERKSNTSPPPQTPIRRLGNRRSPPNKNTQCSQCRHKNQRRSKRVV